MLFFRKAWMYAFLALAVAYGVRYSLRQLDQLEGPLHFAAGAVVAALTAQALFWLVYSRLWGGLVEVISGVRFTAWECFRHQNLLTLGKYLPGKVWGMVARGAILHQRGVSAEATLAATVVEQTLILHSALLMSAALYACLQPSALNVGLACLALASVGLAPQLLRWALALYRRMSGAGVSSLPAPASTPVGMSIYCKYFVGHCAGWLVNGTLFSAIYYAFLGREPTLNVLATLILANTVGVSVGFLAVFAPGGIGVREAVTSGLLLTVMPLEQSLMASVLFRLWLLVTDLVVGVPTLLKARAASQARQ